MTNRSDLVRAVHEAHRANDSRALTQAVAALEGFDTHAASRAAADRELDLGTQIVAHRLEPRTAHEMHTAATDWLAEFEGSGDGNFRTAMITEASTWYSRLDPAVKADREELAQQARGRAHTIASSHGIYAQAAAEEFLSTVGYLLQREGASGLPQIDQTIDPNNQPAPTPYPTEVFETFGEEQDPFNGVEDNNHGSGASSQGAPMIQQILQQDSSGSGFGTGPERPDMHDTRFDTSNSYAEVPLGPAGQIPTTPAPTSQDRQVGSAPNPVAGKPQDAGAEKRQTVAAVEGYSMPDPFGYRWYMQPEIMHPYHAKCGSGHWPEQPCGASSQHTASVAIGYEMDLERARRVHAAEQVGVREGLRAVQASHTLADLGQAHNSFTAAWGTSERTAEDTAVLHGFMAVVRPVLAELGTAQAGKACEACSSGNCQNCTGKGCDCARCGGGSKKTAAKGLAAGGVTESEREHATHHLPGTDKFPISSGADVQNAKHDIGRTNEPESKVVTYINEMAKEYGEPPVGGSEHKKAASLGSGLDFR
jgi:hypothetical protein